MRVKEVDQGVASGALSFWQRWPAIEEGCKDVGLLVAKPVEDLREIRLERMDEPVGDSHAVLDQVPSRFDESPECAHVDAFASQWRELVGMAT